MKKLLLVAGVLAFLGAGCAPAAPVDNGNVAAHANLITVTTPVPNATVASPLTISGEARGTWFFEASFPVELQDTDGNVLAQGHADAGGDWMTEDFVPFTATLSYTVPAGVTSGVLYLRKDNPSGLPANEDDVHFPVQF